MKICCTSDLHGHLPEIPECDLLLIAGDICPATDHSIEFQYNWLRSKFNPWLEKHDVPTILTWGNHDFVGVNHIPIEGYVCVNCTVLNDELVKFQGLKIWGCPHTKTFFNWAFMLDGPELHTHHCQIPEGMDILVMHSPPYGIGDKAPRVHRRPDLVTEPGFENTGSTALLDYIIKNEPKLVVSGHIHCDPGVRKLGNTTLVNATLVDESYRMAYPPHVFEI